MCIVGLRVVSLICIEPMLLLSSSANCACLYLVICQKITEQTQHSTIVKFIFYQHTTINTIDFVCVAICLRIVPPRFTQHYYSAAIRYNYSADTASTRYSRACQSLPLIKLTRIVATAAAAAAATSHRAHDQRLTVFHMFRDLCVRSATPKTAREQTQASARVRVCAIM